MNKWLHKFMEKPDISDNTDISDRFELLDKKMENIHGIGSDKTDRFDLSANMSDLSGHPLGLLDEKLESMSKPDISDRLDPSVNMSDLSGHPQGLLDKKVENNSSKGGDKSARFKFEPNMSPHDGGRLSVLSAPLKGPFSETSFHPLDVTSLLNEYQERVAIAEYDGLQTSTQAERIAYLDAFMAVLATLSYEATKGNWLDQRVKAATEWLLDQGLVQPK